MFGIHNYLGFLLAGIALNITPGADTMYILTRSIAHGKRAGIISVLGICTGCLAHILCAAFGLSLLLTTSATLFALVKYAGAGYLVYLGVKMCRDRGTPFEKLDSANERADTLAIYRQGVLTNALNPKVALFFLSFLPQFIQPEQAHTALPFLILGGTFLTTGMIWCLFLAYAASLMTSALRKNARIGQLMNKMSGVIFIGFGLQLALKHE